MCNCLRPKNTYTHISLRDQLKGVVYQVSPVFVTQSSVVFQKQFGHLVPTIVLVMNHVVSCHISVEFHPADFLPYMYTV